jgi:hypothetical protein
VVDLKELCPGLEEGNEELQAQMLNRSLTEGRQLLVSQANNSLAAEFEAMSENEVSSSSEGHERDSVARIIISDYLVNFNIGFAKVFASFSNFKYANKNS